MCEQPKSRKAKQNVHDRTKHAYTFMVTMTLLIWSHSSAAFTVPSRSTRYLTLFSTMPDKLKSLSEKLSAILPDRKDDDKAAEESSRWLGWMTEGGSKPRTRAVADVYMRDPEELGGVARSARYSSSDWWHNTISFPNSGILRAIRFPVVAMTSWASFISILYLHLVNNGHVHAAKHMCITSTPHSLMVSALGLLLVFRTNSAYQRFAVRICLPVSFTTKSPLATFLCNNSTTNLIHHHLLFLFLQHRKDAKSGKILSIRHVTFIE